jgi:hypothetical protein
MPQDLRFEYMDEQAIKSSTSRFASLAHFQQDDDHIDAFIGEHAHTLLERTCFFPVTHLIVTDEFDLQSARLIPKADANVPDRIFRPDPREAMASANRRGVQRDGLQQDDRSGTGGGGARASPIEGRYARR